MANVVIIGRTEIKACFMGSGLFILFTFILALFTYEQDVYKALGFMGWAVITLLASVAAIIPFVGIAIPILYHVLWSPTVMEFFTIAPSWLTMLTAVVFMMLAVVFEIAGIWMARRFL